MKIKNLQDCEKFLDEIKEGMRFVFPDSDLSFRGCTSITRQGEDYYQFSQGENWRDQQKSYLRNPTSFIWKKRKDIVQGEFI